MGCRAQSSLFAYHTSVHSTSGLTLSFLFFDVEARIPSEIVVGLAEVKRTPAAYALKRYERLCLPYEAMRESAYITSKRAKDY